MLNLRRRGRLAVGGALVAGALGLSATAGAQTGPNANHIIYGSGSSTTYAMMMSLDSLFDQSLGCYMTQPTGTNQTLNFSCASNNQGIQVGEGYTENPLNDVAIEMPALGSSAGIQQVEYGGAGTNGTTLKTAVVNYARSSRQFKTTDYPGLNFVAYATDGVSWFSFPSVGGVASASAKVKNLSLTQLIGIWSGTITNWSTVGGAKAPICVYAGQISSGTSSTWASALGFASPTTANAYVDSNPKLVGCHVPKGQTYATSHTLPENVGQQIVKNGDEGDAIYFFSYGKYQVVCGKTPTGACNNNKPKTLPVLGKINGVAPSPTTILCDTVQCTTQFPVVRDLFNAYSNGSFTSKVSAEFGFPAATRATVNYVSEIGFLCKPQTDKAKAPVLDPTSGVSYRTEIVDIIQAQGFIPFPLQTKGEDVNTVDTPAAAILKATSDTVYSVNDPIVGNGTTANEAIQDPNGYCQVWTTDGNGKP